jgi:peptidoglycan-N-acetylglucosamine deacetylase
MAAFTLAVTVNLQGTTVERREQPEEMLFGRYSYGKYAAAIGCARLFALLDRHGIKATVFVPGAEAEAHPELVRDIADAGHEIAAHGFAMEEYGSGKFDERELLARTHEVLERVTGRTPRGWRAPGGLLSHDTLRVLESLHYRYDASFQDDDQPYSLAGDGAPALVEVPQNEMLIDATLYGLRQTHDRVMKAWREEVAALHAERCFAALTLHPRSDYGSGRASRIAALDIFLDWVRTLPEASFITCLEAVDRHLGA